MISAAAFFISIMTTVVSWYRTYQQDIISLRAELRTIIQDTNKVSLLHLELFEKYKDNQQAFLNASSTLNSQNIVLAKAAYSLIKQLGGSASSLDLTTTANALIQSSEFLLAEELLKMAAKRAANSIEEVAALRILGSTQFQIGKANESKDTFIKAVDIFARYPKEAVNEGHVNMTHAYTHLFWATVLVSSDCQGAKQSVNSADRHLSLLPSILPQANTLRSEFRRVANLLSNCPTKLVAE